MLPCYPIGGFHWAFFALNWVGSTSNASTIMLPKGEKMIRNCTYSLPSTRPTHRESTFNSLRWLCLQFELTPTQIYDVTWNPRILVNKEGWRPARNMPPPKRPHLAPNQFLCETNSTRAKQKDCSTLPMCPFIQTNSSCVIRSDLKQLFACFWFS